MSSFDANGNNLEKVVAEGRTKETSRVLCHPLPGEEVVITGMAGKFPESDDVYQFGENLFKKVDLITEDNRRWKPTNSEVPHRMGKLNDISAFDAGFFGICSRHSNNMDIYVRMLLERTYEVIVDAGYHPSELVGTKTGVFISSSLSDSENYILRHKLVVNSSTMTGVIRSAMANHISYFFRLQGPSCNVDSACSSALSAIEHAYRSIRQGICDMVIVGGVNLCLHPKVSWAFARTGVLSSDGRCKTFDNKADGFVRSESVAALFLQKSKDARRIYAHILHSKLTCDGYKPQGVAHPSSLMQTVLMKEVYRECNVELSDVNFIEAHGTGTKVGDLQELTAFTDVFCHQKRNPLYIGAVKSNAGHAEPAAALLSIIKVLLAMECGFLPPNLNFTQPREDVEALVDGRLKVITEKTPWPNEKRIAGVNSLGIGGANGHLVLRWNEKQKRNFELPKEDLPRLVCVSGRTKEAVDIICDDLKHRCLDTEFVNLLNTVFEKHTSDHPFRGYQILSKVGELKRSVHEIAGDKNKLAWIFNNFDPNWPKVDKQMMVFPEFAKTWEKIQNIVTKKLDVEHLETLGQVNQTLATMVFQICLAALLKSVGLIPDILIGLGTGELVVAYLEDYLTLDEVICAHFFVGNTFCNNRNKSSIGEELRNNLKDLKLNRNSRFQKWLPLYQRDHFHKQGSPEYFARNIAEPFDLNEVKELLSSDCDVLVIGGTNENFKHLSLIRDDSLHPVLDFLGTLGRFYEKGHDLRLNNLYTETTWPVGRGTPMISPLIKWNHSREWFVAYYKEKERIKHGEHIVRVDVKSKDWNFISGHDIDGRILFPATGFLFLVWETFSKMTQKATSDMKVVFEDVRFIQSINLTNQDPVKLFINISEGDNTFQVTQHNDLIMTGKIYEEFDTRDEFKHFPAFDYPEKKITLTQSEVYRKLRIRGYHYRREFKAIHSVTGKENGLIQWTGNWVTFMDNMLQASVLYEESRNLCIPTSIKQVIIDPKVHLKFVDKGTLIPVRTYYDSGIVRSGGIQFTKMKGNSIARRKPRDPVLETYKFIPNVTALSLEHSVRVILQIILENNRVSKFKSVEIPGNSKLISPHMKQTLDDIIFVQAEITVLSENSLDFPGVTVEDKDLSEKDNLHLVVLPLALEKGEMLYDALKSVEGTNGYILIRQSLSFDILVDAPYGLDVSCVHTTDSEVLVLLRKPSSWRQPSIINVSNDLMWLSPAQDALKQNQPLIFYSQNRFTDGILGLVNCLRKEANGGYVTCFFIIDDAPRFDPNHPFYEKQIRKNMAVNVWKAGEWGTYRYLPLKDNPVIQCDICYANVVVPGELSSIEFTEGSPSNIHQLEDGMQMIYVYWSALNFRDVLIATGRIPTDILGRSRSVQESLLGTEFSGRDITGRRVMGVVPRGALTTHVVTESSSVWAIPDEWSLEDAATVPSVYVTSIYALLMETNIKRGQSILIHSGTGGVGQAAVNIALYFECTIFVTVGSQEKRDFLRKNFPQLKESHIGNSRDTSFEQMVLLQTQGRGVDIVLNSLSEEKLLASVNCLARNGTFLEIGKFDFERDNELNLKLFGKGVNFQSVMLDFLFTCKGKSEIKRQLLRYFTDLLREGVVKPLPRTVFKKEEVVDAFKFMTTGKHIGKVLVNIREEEDTLIASVKNEVFEGLPRFYCDAEGTYIVLGGLGGFGLELVDWLIMRGAKKLVLSSRTGLKTGYQAMMMKAWQSSGIQISVRTEDVTTKAGCTELITCANSLGPVKAIFNLAVVLRDAPFEKQTVETFKTTLAPKAFATQNLDAISRTMCPQLSHFVVFSSVTSGKGNVEQSNYGMANSIIERICEKRKADGFPALAIQWGLIADVGIIAELQETTETEIVMVGSSQQRISSCLQVLDSFLRQKEPIVGSVIIANKSTVSEENIIDNILNILGIMNAESINPYMTFAELGMDSIMNSEIRQTLQREIELFLTTQQIRAMTVAKLQDIVKTKKRAKQMLSMKEEDDVFKNLKKLLHFVEDETCPVIRTKDGAIKTYILPGLDGTITPMKQLIQRLNVNVTCLQYDVEATLDTIEEWAESILPSIDVNSNFFLLIGYSFGCVVATELAFLLEKNGRQGKIVFLDGAPNMLTMIYRRLFGLEGKEFVETNVVCLYMMMHLPTRAVLKHKNEILKCTSLEDRVKLCLTILPPSNRSEKFLFDMSLQCCRKMKAMLSYSPKYSKLKSQVKLIKSRELSVFGFAEDYGLSSLFEKVEEIEEFEEGHLDILENLEVARSINAFFSDDEVK